MRCFKCLKEVPAGTEVCPNCGQALMPKTKKPDKTDKGVPDADHSPNTENRMNEYQIGDSIKDRYDVRDVLSKKGIGFTYKVRDREKKKIFVLKEIQPTLVTSGEAKTKLFDIIKTVITLNLPEVTAITDQGEDNGIAYFVTEHIEGLTLRKLLDVRKEMKQFFKGEELESILTHICKALIAAHNNGIVHGDLKPENIFILPSGIKITELGITGALSPLDFTAIQQDLGNAYRYIAPEVVIGGALSKTSDIYSLGVIVYEMLTGIIPGGVISSPSASNSEIPKAADGILTKALQQDPERRTQSVSEFYRDILQAFGQKAQSFEEKPWAGKSLPDEEQAGQLHTEVDEELRMYMESGAAAQPPSEEQKGAEKEEQTPQPPEPEHAQEMEATQEKPSAPETADESNRITQEKPAAGQPEEQAAVAEQETPPSAEPVKSPEDAIKQVMAEEEKAGQTPPPPSGVSASEEPKPEKEEQEQPAGMEHISKSLETFTEEIQGRTREEKPAEADHYPPAGGTSPSATKEPVQEKQSEAVSQPAPVVREVQEAKKSPVALIIAVIAVVVIAGLTAAWFLLKPSAQKTQVAAVSRQNVREKEKPASVPQPAPAEAKTAAKPPVEAPVAAPPPPKPKAEAPVKRPRRERRVAAVPKPAPKCPDDMVYIPAGNFIMGSSPSDPLRDFSEKADVRTYVRAFCIDRYEYPDQEGTLPQVNISFYAAERACRNENKRLCTEDEWEKACKGPTDRKYPYGNSWNANKCNTQNKEGTSRSIVPAGSYRACVNAYGAYDMSGNVMEWTNNVFSAQDTADRVVKGGSYAKPDWATRCAYRYNMLPNSTSNEVGFRCCKGAAK